MPVIHNIADHLQVINYLQATGTYDTVAQAIEAGVVNTVGKGGVTYLYGGPGMPVISYDDALQVAKTAQNLGATAAEIATAAVTLAKAAGAEVKYTLVGACTLELPAVAAMCAPLAGVALGEGLYRENPQLWTKISQTLLPYCYAENKIQAYLEYVVDQTIGFPVMCIATSIIDALRNLFEEEGVLVNETYEKTDSQGRTVYGVSGGPVAVKIQEDLYGGEWKVKESGQFYPNRAGDGGIWWGSPTVVDRNGTTVTYYPGTSVGHFTDLGVGTNDYTEAEILAILGDQGTEPEVIPATAGVEAPVIEPWTYPGFSPDYPLIIVEPGAEPVELPVTPVTPLLPAPEPVPLLPEHVPDPTPEEAPENWPEEEPWPTVVPFPFQPTEPDPGSPEVMPWPLPPERPEEWPTSPEVPKEWPEEYPTTKPWPYSPDQWPEEVPWPESPPEDWPEEVPWPSSPDQWPEEVPWPAPWPEDWPTYPPSWPEPYPTELPWPSNPDDWPIEVPWPETSPEWWPETTPWPTAPDEWPETVPWPMPPVWPIPWPDELPYPWPYPYPEPSPDPYPDPTKLTDPESQIDPYIDPWPWPYPDPYPDPTPDPKPYRDPTQPDPQPRPQPEPQPEPDDPYPTPPSGTPTPPIPPVIPLPFSSTTGLISVYHPTQSELLSFASWLWVTWQDATIDKIWNNPFDGVIALFELYCTPTDVGRKNIRSGFLDSGVSSETISRYTSIDCGSIAVPEYFGNYFDYSPYSKCHIYLPFIGIVELNVDDVVGHGVNVTYRIDEYNGSCIAMITCAKSTIVNGEEVDYSVVTYQFSGNCAVELPLAGGSQAAIKAGMLEAAAWGIGSVIGGVMSGSSIGEIASGMAYGAASAVHSVVSAKSSVQHSGSFGSSYGAMGAKVPYIIVTRPKQIQVPNYNELYGYQAHKMVRIGDCTGYLRCREVHVISPTASDEEKAQIEQLLKTGVYITE